MLPISEEQLDAMAERERIQDFAPLNDWNTIAARLRAEGLIRAQPRFASSRMPWMQAAAAALIAIGGIAVGRYSVASAASRNSTGSVAAAPGDAGSGSVEAASFPASGTSTFTSADEAWQALNSAGEQYQKASAYLSANNSAQAPGADSSAIYEKRLVALEQVMHATRSALDEAPNDPVINQYYLATMGAREATQEQLKLVHTAGLKLKGF